jgi:hypothetical protein
LDDILTNKNIIFPVKDVKPTTFLFVNKLIIEHKFEYKIAPIPDLLKLTEELIEHTPTFLEMNYLAIKLAKFVKDFVKCESYALKLKDYDLNDRWGNNT